jgi:hypothetical protein
MWQRRPRRRGRARRRPCGSARPSPPPLRHPPGGVGFGGIPIRFRLFSMVCRETKFPSPQPASRARRLERRVALAKTGIHETARGRVTSGCGRAGRSRGLGDLRQRPSRCRWLGSPASGSAWGDGVFCRAWPRWILVFGGRTKRIACLQIFRNKISKNSKAG